MEIDELKSAWQELNARQNRLEIRMDTERLGSKLTGFYGLTLFEVISNIVAVILVGGFLAAGPHSAAFLVPGVVLQALVLVALVCTAWQLGTLRHIDYAGPVVEIQRRLALVRTVRIRFVQWVLLAGPLLWVPMYIVGLAWLGVDAYRTPGPAYISASIAFGVVWIPLAYWVAKAVGQRFSGNPGLQRIMDDLGGRSLAIALQELDRIGEFGA